ncbi:hypothetical protein [Clostridium scatologenes]|uniref:Uncharacterized protein n=1 Tax=Clostridium scatologenes TaxID=1548 RepID=A0A0E3M7B2_CLOSL|nr:hypothetical protein [Clostridium scatologenes]AKA70150.1 hypothetical protein CSCA_3025 [Clostridium scatologenes]
MDSNKALEIIKSLGFKEDIDKNLLIIKYEGLLDKSEFIIEDDNLYKNKCFIIGGNGGNGVVFVVDSVTGKAYESLGKNDDIKRTLRFVKDSYSSTH